MVGDVFLAHMEKDSRIAMQGLLAFFLRTKSFGSFDIHHDPELIHGKHFYPIIKTKNYLQRECGNENSNRVQNETYDRLIYATSHYS